MKRKNELNARDALIEILERMTGVRYECESSPDEGSNHPPEVDFILKSTRDEIHRIAVEHTVIELFIGQKDYVRWSSNIVEEIKTGCRGKIPSDRYYFLRAPPIFISSLSKKKRKMAFVDSLAPWIVQHARQLKVDEFLSCTYEAHKITLTCEGRHPSLNGNVWSMPELPVDHETLQKDSFHKAINHGLKKLREYKLNGFTTVILLEDIAGVKYGQLIKELRSFDKDQIDRFVDYIVVLVSNNDRMIVGNVWKENDRWYSIIPHDRRFYDLHNPP
jgi:hypothetical protein